MIYNVLNLKRFTIIIFFSLVLITMMGCAKTQSEHSGKTAIAEIEGVWTGSAQQTGSPNPTFTLKLNAKESGEVWGTITSMDGTFEQAIISGGKIAEGKLTFSATANGTNFRNGHSFSFDADVKGDQLEGIWKDILDRNWGSFTVIREKQSAASKDH